MIDPAVIHASAASGDNRYPYAAWLPIPEQQNQPAIWPVSLIFHSMAGPRLTSLEALRAYMGRDDVHIESTLMSDLAGRMAQLVECTVRADCNAKANRWWDGARYVGAISIETQDEGAASLAGTPWSPLQLEQHAGLAAWAHLRYAIPLRICRTWNDPGIGYHRLFPEWSIYVGKSCPGDARVDQMPALLARAREIAAWRPDTPEIQPPTWRPGGTVLHTCTPKKRIVDTRTGLGLPKRRIAENAPTAVKIPLVATSDGRLVQGKTAVVNVTVIGPVEHGFVQVDGNRFGDTSDGNFVPGEVKNAPTIAAIRDDGTIQIRLIECKSADLTVDLLGVVD
jgi:hypothetical protein